MTKRTEIVASAELKRRIPPARPMAITSMRQRTPGWVSAKAVGSFVPGLTKKAFEKFGFSTAALITDWEKIAGAKFAAFTAPQRLKWPQLPGSRADAAGEPGNRPGATLVIKVDPARALEAEYAGAQIIDRINAYFGYRAVAEIRLLQAPIVQPQTVSRPARVPAAIETVPENGLNAALARLQANVAARPRQD